MLFVVARIGKNGGKPDALPVGEVSCAHAVVMTRGCFNAENAFSEFSNIEVRLKDAALGPSCLHHKREHHFLEFADIAFLVGQKQIFNGLLRNGGAARRAFAFNHVVDEGFACCAPFNAKMFHKANVFGGNCRADHFA